VNIEERFRSEPLRELYDYWLSLRGEKPAPARSQVDPMAMTQILPHLGLFDVVNNPRRYRVRIMGTEVVAWYGCDVTGRYLDEIDLGPDPAPVFAILDHVVATMTPAHMMGDYVKQDGRQIRYERLVLPLSSDGRETDMLLGASLRIEPSA